MVGFDAPPILPSNGVDLGGVLFLGSEGGFGESESDELLGCPSGSMPS